MIVDRTALSPLGAAPLGGQSTGLLARAVDSAGNDFATVVSNLAANAIGTLKAADAASMAAVRGDVPVQQVVDAVMAAEQTLQSTIAIRDKIVAAYLELTRMQI